VSATASSRGLPGRRAELVFAYLAAEHHRVVSRDELADALWPDRLPSSWSAALRGVVTEVRRFLDDGGLDAEHILATVRSGYQLVLPAGVVTDLDVVRGDLAEASAALRASDGAGATGPAGRVSLLCGLPFLPEHEGEWVAGVRRELQRARARALALEAEARAMAGDSAGAVDAAVRLVEVEPFDESAHQLRIRLLAEAGDGAGALRAFEHCREVLMSELGVEPSLETAAARLAVPVRRGPTSAPAQAPTLAAAADHDLAPVQHPAETSGSGLDRLGVLVVEDHDFQRRTLVQILASLGVAWVDAAADGAEALDRLTRPPTPDIIICDIDMPEMDGVELVRHIAERDPGSAIIITSGLDASVLRAVEALGSGYGLEVRGALAKPLTARRLCEVLFTCTPRCSGPSDDSPPNSVTADDVRRALAAGVMTAHFQPRLDLATGELCAVVATARWPADDPGRIPPAAFLAAAARAQLLGAVTDQLLSVSCRLLKGAAGLNPEVAVEVPVPGPCLLDVALADRWAQIVSRHQFPCSQVVAAVDARDNPTGPTVLDVMTRLRLKGFGLTLHGFDGGPAARAHAERLPLTGLALAGRLVSGAGAEPPRRDLLEAALDSAGRLGLPLVAEGCDGEADFEMLLALGCRQVQGAFLGAPMPAHQLHHWIQAWPIGIAERA